MPILSFDADGPGLPPIERVRVVVTPAEQTTLFTVPVTLVVGRPGKILLPTHLHIRKEAGTAWTTTGSGTLRIKYGNVNSHHWNAFDQTATTAFFGAGEAVWLGEAGKGQYWGYGDMTSSATIVAADIVLDLSTANISGGSGNLICNIWFRSWDGV